MTFSWISCWIASGRYVNYVGDEERGYGGGGVWLELARLQQVKAKYDPDNFFHMNQHIRLVR